MTKGDIKEYQELILLHFTGKCSPEQQNEIESWILENDNNLNEYFRLRNIWEAEHPAFDASAVNIDAARKAAIQSISSGHTEQQNHSKFVVWWKNIAAVLLLPLFCWAAAVTYEKYSGKEPEPEWLSFSTPYGIYADVVLPDGTKVTLNSGSRISYPSRFTGKIREVNLDGEAYFEVRSNEEHPFSVKTKGIDVVATGTEFNIEAYLDWTQRITLVSGRLGINAHGKSYTLPQGYQLMCGPGDSVKMFATDTFKWTAWKDGTTAFRGDPLSYVFERLSAIHNVKITVKDPKVSDYQIRATFRNESLDHIMSLIEQSAPIRCRRVATEDEGIIRTEYQIYSK